MLILLILSSYSPRPVISLFQVRIVLLVLIAVLTLLAKIWSTVGPLSPTGGGSGYFKLSLFMFFTDIDLAVVVDIEHARRLIRSGVDLDLLPLDSSRQC